MKLKEGDEVLYNYQGSTAYGIILKITDKRASINWINSSGMNLCPDAFWIKSLRKLTKLEKALK